MGGSPRQGLADRRTGCIVCDAWGDQMIVLVGHTAAICRHPCVTRVGRAILAAGPSLLAQLWTEIVPVAESRTQTSASGDAEEVFASFKEGVAKQISVDDAQSHFDLAVAYGEMGLMPTRSGRRRSHSGSEPRFRSRAAP